jgi:hypothetical protein
MDASRQEIFRREWLLSSRPTRTCFRPHQDIHAIVVNRWRGARSIA